MDIYFADKLHGWAIGAFSLMLVTEDGGVSWKTLATDRLREQLEAADREPSQLQRIPASRRRIPDCG
ncbi:MAG: hypothetical protein IPH23_08885 [Gammaproteobacteria bacterium]|nr:hypothetical protein [Gammaproteobacteria bacterium]